MELGALSLGTEAWQRFPSFIITKNSTGDHEDFFFV
jgi:hypothetical protein